MRQKIVIVGAGSSMFTQGIMIDWLRQKPTGEWEFFLVDIEPDILAATERTVRRYAQAAKAPVRVSATTNRREALREATVVLCTIGVGGRRAWEQDVLIPRKYGVFQPVGDTAMPGGISRALRMIPQVIDIAKDVERICPQARFFNYANPMTAIVRAVRQRTSLEVVGLCVGVDETLKYLARFAGVAHETVTAKWAGVNHLTWILEFRSNGADMFPELRAKVAEQQRNGLDGSLLGRMFWDADGKHKTESRLEDAPFSWELFEEFGAFPAPMDRHVVEFFPERFPGGSYYGKTLGVNAYSFEACIAYGDRIYETTFNLEGEGPVDPQHLNAVEGEHTQLMQILDSLQHDRRRWYSVNLPNCGAVSNLPDNAILELPGVATADGFVAPPIGELPAPITAVLLRRLAAVEATAEAALTGNRKLVAEAIILDGSVADYAMARKLGEELLRAHAAHLPQFS
jgi:alpha-galactosidase